MADQYVNPPAPSRSEFQQLSDQIANKTVAESIVVTFSNINSKITIHNTYHYAYCFGAQVNLFILMTVSSEIASWSDLFTITNAKLKPAFQQRFPIAQGIVAYNDSTGYVGNQDKIPAGTYAIFGSYIRSL